MEKLRINIWTIKKIDKTDGMIFCCFGEDNFFFFETNQRDQKAKLFTRVIYTQSMMEIFRNWTEDYLENQKKN